MVYRSLDNKKIKQIKKLRQKKYRDETNLFLVEGEHIIEEALKSNCLKSVIIEENTTSKITKDNIYVSDKVMKHLSELDNYYPMIGICFKPKKQKIGKRVLVLDNIQDPGNLGTIIRSAVAFNFDTIILSPDTVDLYNSKVIRASQGMLFHLNIIINDLFFEVTKLKEQDYKIIGTKVDVGTDISEFSKLDKLVLIMGNEGQGVKEEVLSLCDFYAHIKMSNSCESLNVAIATSIMLYELSK